MTVLEQKKYRLIRAIIDDMDEKRVSKVEKLYAPSFMCSVDELKASIDDFERDLASGTLKGISSGEIERKEIS